MIRRGAGLMLAAGLAFLPWPAQAGVTAVPKAAARPMVSLPVAPPLAPGYRPGLLRALAAQEAKAPSLPALQALTETGLILSAGADENGQALALRFDADPRAREELPVAEAAAAAPGDGAPPRQAPEKRPLSLRSFLGGLKLAGILFVHGAASHSGIGAGMTNAAVRSAASGFLQEFETIRIGVDKAPGNGHQAASATVMKRLRQLGFRGRFEVVYAPTEKDKLEYLLSGFDPQGPSVQELPASGITAIESGSPHSGDLDWIPLGIVGATDRFLKPFWLRAEQLLTIQPFRWEGATLQFWRSWTSRGTTSESWESVPLRGLYHLPLAYDLPDPEDAGAFIAEKMSATPEMLAKVPGLASIVEAADRIETLPAYGLGMNEGREKLLNLMRGVRYAQRKNPGRFRGGVVIPLISRLDDQEMALLARSVAEGAALLERVFSVDVEDPDVVRRVEGLQKGDILLVRVGPVAQDVFEYLFSRSTLPPTLAGRNGANLMLLARKPFFKTNSNGAHAFPKLLRGSPRRVRKLVAEAHDELQPRSQGSGQAVGEFILAFMEEGSALRAAFDGKRPRKLDRDKVAEALLRSAKQMKLPFLSPGNFIRRLVWSLKNAARTPSRSRRDREAGETLP